MRVVVALLSMAVTATAFAPLSPSSRTSVLSGLPEEISDAIAENQAKADKWSSIRLLSDEEAEEQLSGDDLETFKEYHSNNKEDIEKLKGVATMMLKSLEPPVVAPKGKKQRKRDKWARTQAIAAARAAAN
mmetsp:Transcript_3497/g.4070  ORF Transcript_3497/g.4070 Transcript_3497/m.4070 type:complete len:131 (-) Transcript_3497:55-447(-)